MSSEFVFNVTAADFQELVERSTETPVLLDFWAEWCGPCKTLGPVLEQMAADYAGGFLLGKIDADRETELSAAFQVQGIPFCVLIQGGRPVDAFQGALPRPELEKFLAKHGVEPAAETPEAPAEEADPDSPEARMNRGRQALAQGDAAGVTAALEGFPEEHELASDAARIVDSLPFLTTDVSAMPGAASAAVAQAQQLFRERQLAPTMDSLLQSVAEDKSFADGIARKGMLLCFALIGEDNEACDEYRRRLATLLY